MASTEFPISEKEALFSSTHVTDTVNNIESDPETDAEHDKGPLSAQDGSLPNPRFDPPTPSPLRRAALIAFTFVIFWFALNIRMDLWKNKREANVVYASRYSKEHKFRPAASPIITETLKDGRVQIRGAAPTVTPVQIPAPTPKKANRKKIRKGKVPGKKDGKSKARK